MIARLEGIVLSADEGAVVVNVGGVGFLVHVPLRTEVTVGQPVVLHTYLQVRENELSLYGFSDAQERTFFEWLLGVSGVGPKAALSVLSTLSLDALRRAILNRQPEVLSRAPGVGKKTAEAIVLHLKDRFATFAGPVATVTEDDADVIAALTTLGFSLIESQRALQQLPRDSSLSVEEKIRRALALLS